MGHLMTSTTVMLMPPVTTLQDHSCASATLVTPVMVSFVRMMTSVLIQYAMNMPLAPILMVHSNAHVTLVSLVTDSLVLTLMSARPLLPSYLMEIAVMLMHCVRIPLVDSLVLAMPVTRELVSFVLILMS